MTPVIERCRQENEEFNVILGYVRFCFKETKGYRRNRQGDNRKPGFTNTVFKLPIKIVKI